MLGNKHIMKDIKRQFYTKAVILHHLKSGLSSLVFNNKFNAYV